MQSSSPINRGGQCLHELVEVQAEATPEVDAVICAERSLTYRQLNERANQLAHHLRALGVKPDMLVGVCMDRSLDLIVALLGVLKSGAAYLPIDRSHPADRLAFMLADARAPLLLTQTHLAPHLSQSLVQVICLDDASLPLWSGPKSNPRPVASVDHLAYVIYTSGSTGKPKGVQISHRNVVRLFAATRDLFHFDERDVWSLFHSYAFDFSVWEIWGALLHGGRLVIVPFATSRSPLDFYRLLSEKKVTVLNQTPSAFKQLSQAEEAATQLPPLALRLVIFGGEALEMSSLKAWFERHGDQTPRLVNMYGITETTVHVTYRPLSKDDLTRGSVIGAAISDLQVYILDANLDPTPIGVAGEIFVGGAGLARGYLNRPDLTAERFIPDRFSSDNRARLYRTGDLARRLATGDIEYLGRIDQQVKLRGHRIELGEIEAAVTEHPDFVQCVVLVREDQPGDKRLVAYVVPRAPSSTPGAAELRDTLKRKLPDYMLPSAFVILEKLPLTANGKIDRVALPAPALNRDHLSQAYVTPRTPTEEALAGIWAEVLRVRQVGARDNFFELGGDSLLATRVVAKIQDRWRVHLPMRVMFDTQCLSELAQYIEAMPRTASPAKALVSRHRRPDEVVILSSPQERVCFVQQLDPECMAYVSQTAPLLRGPWNAEILERSLSEVVRRHEILRTTFPEANGRRVQTIHPAQPVQLPVVDLSDLPAEERPVALARVIQDHIGQRFDVARLPLIRWKLVRMAAAEYRLIHVEHHLVHDGWSFNTFLRDLLEIYTAFSAGRPSPLPELEVQYADYAEWQREWLETPDAAAQLEYWRKQLDGAKPALALPYDRARPPAQRFRGHLANHVISATLFKSLQDRSRACGVTLYATMLAAFATLLSRYACEDDICIGAGMANRRRPETENLLGMIVNNVVLRLDLSGNPSVRELLGRVRQVVLDAAEHQELPFDKVVEALEPQRTLARNPLFQVMFNFHDLPMPAGKLPPDLQVDELDLVGNGTAKFDLNIIGTADRVRRVNFDASAEAETMRMNWEYNTDLFDAATIATMMQHYNQVLEAFTADPERPISDVAFTDPVEPYRISDYRREGPSSYPRDSRIEELFEEQARRTPDAIAVEFAAARLTYAELNARANQLAHSLRRRGAHPGEHIGICLSRSLELIVAILAILKAGCAYVPLDATYPDERLSFMLEDARVRFVVTLTLHANRFPAKTIVALDDEPTKTESETNPENVSTADDTAYVMYTSGSAGRPKGVAVVHRGVVRLVKDTDYAVLNSEEVLLQFASISFDASTFEIWGALLNGGRLVVFPPDMPSPTELAEFVEAHGVTTLWLTAGLFHQMADGPLARMRGLRQLLAGGDVLSPAHVQKAIRALPDCRFINGYGPTEGTTFTCCHTIKEPLGGSVPIGKPISHSRVCVLDSKLHPVPGLVPGELHIGGDGLAKGYVNRPELTAERFIRDPFSSNPTDRLYKTGDLVRCRTDGNIEFLRRLDQQVKIRGFRVELGEIESALALHPGVRECIAIAREDEPGEKELAAYVVPAEANSKLGAAELRDFLMQKLPSHMLPSGFVMLAKLPLTANGKVDRKALPRPQVVREQLSRAYVAPRTPTETTVAEIWAEVLKIEVAGAHDNFFELGGHSLLATQVVSRVTRALKVNLPLRALFEHPTIAGLAQAIDALIWTAHNSVAPFDKTDLERDEGEI